MKKFRAIFSLTLILAMTVALSVTAFADNSQPNAAIPTSDDTYYYFYDPSVSDYIKVVKGTNVKLGDYGSAVKAVQLALFEISEYHNSTAMHPGKIDSSFGEKTKSAVIAYQERKQITADGQVGKTTFPLLEADYGFLTGTTYNGR